MEEKPRGQNWNEGDRIAAISIILEHKDKLFNCFKGASLGSKEKEKRWEEIGDQINASSCCLRTPKEIKKMYSNLKTRAKEKKHALSQTGGGPGKKMTTSEIMLLEGLKDNPELIGISGGIDLHVREDTSEETSSSTNMSGCLPVSKNNSDGSTSSGTISGCLSKNNKETSSSTTMTGCVSQNHTDNPGPTSRSSTMLDSQSTSTSTSVRVPNNVKSACSKSTKRIKEDQEDDIYTLEAKKIKLEIEELKTRIEHNQVLFELKKTMLDMEVKKLLNENLLDMQGMTPLQCSEL